MIRRGGEEEAGKEWVPRARGDAPVFVLREAWFAGCSPHPRG